MRLTTASDQLALFRREATTALSPYAPAFPKAAQAVAALDQRFSQYDAVLSALNEVEKRITAYELAYQQASADYSRVAVAAPDPAYTSLASWSESKRRLLALREDIAAALEFTAANALPPLEFNLTAAESAIKELILAIPSIEYECLTAIATTQRPLTAVEQARMSYLRDSIMRLTSRSVALPNA